MPLPKELVDIVACPKCKKRVTLQTDERGTEIGFQCAECKLLYPIEEGLPNFLIDEARPL